MSRASSASDTVVVAPTNNVYTGLLAAAVVGVIIGLVVVFLRGNALGIKFY